MGKESVPLQLPLRKKIFYGMGAVSINLCDLVFMQWLFVRYAPSNGPTLVSPWLIGVCILGGRAIESVLLPMLGYWSDNLRLPSGRRLPFIRRAFLPLAVIIFFMWNPLFPAGSWLNSLHLIAGVVAYVFVYNCMTTPYLALLPELTSNLKERVDVATIQAIFLTVSAMTFGLMGIVLDRGGWKAMSGTVAVLTVLFMLPVALVLREKPPSETAPPERMPFFKGLQIMLHNRAFLGIVISASFYWFGLDVVLKLVPLWVRSYLGESEAMVTTLMLPFLVTNIIGFAFINVLAKRFGKFAIMLGTFVATALAFLLVAGIGFLGLGSPLVQTAVVMALIGLAVAGFMSLPFAILSDVVDYDEQLTGRRREAIFFGFQGTFQKLTLGISGFTFGHLAYQYSDGASAVSVGGLRLLAVLAGIGCLIGFLIFLSYPLRERDGKLVLK